ncbi:ATP-grasp domain-containing protein, partial [Burkholderia pseudomallei]
GEIVNRLLIVDGADIKKELFVGIVIDRVSQKVVVMASSEGGMDIDEVAEKTPEAIHKVAVEPSVCLQDAEADDLAKKIGVPDASIAQA